MHRTLRQYPLLLCLLMALSACSGGGSSSGQTTANTYTLGGQVSGLSGSVVLRNGTSNLIVISSGNFAFPQALPDGSSYNVTILTQPTDQTCAVTDGTGAIAGGAINSVRVACITNTYTIGGTISGLSGTMLLQNNNGDDLSVNASGAFAFTTPITAGTAYDVAVQNQPADQTCAVSNGSGTASGGNVTGISIVCVDNTVVYTVGGTISGLAGTVILQNNGGNNLTVSSNGSFTFTTALNTGSTYRIEVLTQPAGQTCTVSNGSSTLTANVNNVTILCVMASYTLGGTITGLTGNLVLQNNGSDDLLRLINGGFAFATLIPNGSSYNVTILTQPAGQVCTLSNATGTVAGAAVTNIGITCVTNTYAIGFTISGLLSPDVPENSVVLANNGGDNKTVANNGSDTFTNRIAHGSTYNVTVVTQPAGRTCAVLNGSGTATANVTDIQITCGLFITVSASKPRELTFTWPADASATYYKLYKNPDGHSGFTQLGGNITTTTATDVIPVHLHDWINASYQVEACNTSGCTSPYAPTYTTAAMLQAIGYFKAANTEAADGFGYALALSADGSTLAVGAPYEKSAATGVNGAENDNSAAAAGAVYIFTRSGTTWTAQAYIKASNTGTGDLFGAAVALSDDGNLLAASAPGETSAATGINGDQTSNSVASAGAVYTFTRAGSTWSQQAYIKASNTGKDDYFGFALTLSGNGSTLAVASPFEDSAANSIDGDQSDNTTPSAGAIYVFTNTANTWSQQAYIKAANAEKDEWFGYALALSADGNTLAAGALFEDSALVNGIATPQNNAAANAGAVYTFTRAGSAWSQQAYLKASNAEAGDLFGTAIALSADGNTLVAGATSEQSSSTGINGDQTNNTLTGAGAAYVFVRTDNIWNQQAYLKASNTNASDLFGTRLALSTDGNILAISATGESGSATGSNGDQTSNAASNAGALYVFTRSAAIWSQKTYLKAANTGAGDSFGTAVALSGDGQMLAASAPGEDSASTGVGGDAASNAATDAGAVYLY